MRGNTEKMMAQETETAEDRVQLEKLTSEKRQQCFLWVDRAPTVNLLHPGLAPSPLPREHYGGPSEVAKPFPGRELSLMCK